MWEHPPLTARPQHIQDGVDDDARLVLARWPYPRRGQQRRQPRPLCLRQVRGIAWLSHVPPPTPALIRSVYSYPAIRIVQALTCPHRLSRYR